MIARAAMPALPPIACGAIRDGSARLLPPCPGIPAGGWERFVDALAINDDDRDGPIGKPRAINARGHAGLGIFGFRPLRLADLGIMRAGQFAAPHSADTWLDSPQAWIYQFAALRDSLRRFAVPPPAGALSRSGMWALLHRLGPHALESRTNRKSCPLSTAALLRRTNGLF